MTIDSLIAEMQQVKADNDALSITDVLRIFQIQATRDLTKEIERARNG